MKYYAKLNYYLNYKLNFYMKLKPFEVGKIYAHYNTKGTNFIIVNYEYDNMGRKFKCCYTLFKRN